MKTKSNDHPGLTTADSYARGRADAAPNVNPDTVYAPKNIHPLEIADAVEAWRLAASDHGHASFYGADYIRRMRAYWLGRARGYTA